MCYRAVLPWSVRGGRDRIIVPSCFCMTPLDQPEPAAWLPCSGDDATCLTDRGSRARPRLSISFEGCRRSTSLAHINMALVSLPIPPRIWTRCVSLGWCYYFSNTGLEQIWTYSRIWLCILLTLDVSLSRPGKEAGETWAAFPSGGPTRPGG